MQSSRGVCGCDGVRDTAFSVNLVCGLFDRCDSALTAAIMTLLNNDLKWRSRKLVKGGGAPQARKIFGTFFKFDPPKNLFSHRIWAILNQN